jgi:transposase
MMEQKRRTYSQQFKIDAVRLITEQGYKYSEAARNLGINHSVLKTLENRAGIKRCGGLPRQGPPEPGKRRAAKTSKKGKNSLRWSVIF